MIKNFLIAALTLILPLCLNAQNGKMEAMRNIVADSYNFWLYTPSEADMRIEEPDTKFDEVALPENIKTPPPPVIIFLHGASLCGTDLYKVRRYGCLDAISRGRNINAVIIAPQNPGGAWNPKKIMDIVKWVNDNREIDTTRIYAIGMSLGGYGTMDLAGTYPDKIAAAMALCGGCYLKDQTGLGKLPLWIRPEAGFSKYIDSDYTNAFYVGGRVNWDITDKMHLGAWSSFAWGAEDKRWDDDPVAKDYDGGFIWNIRPDFTFDVNERHSLTASFEYESKKVANGDTRNKYVFGFFWKYKRAF